MKLYQTALLALSAQALIATAQAAPGDVFYCGSAGDAEIYAELDAENSDLARTRVVMGGEYADASGGPIVTDLTRTSGTIYEGDGQKLIVIGDQAEYSDPSGTYSCSPSEASALAGPASPEAMPEPAIVSWGGKLRSKPSTESKQTGSLQFGQRVTVVEKTGVMFQGFPWFEVATEGGKTGFTWGGILCDATGQTDGMFNENGCQ